jgi:hypothetical protein
MERQRGRAAAAAAGRRLQGGDGRERGRGAQNNSERRRESARAQPEDAGKQRCGRTGRAEKFRFSATEEKEQNVVGESSERNHQHSRGTAPRAHDNVIMMLSLVTGLD